jgi:hypothetical protein
MSENICQYCDNTGFISVINDDGYEYSFKCVCHKGTQIKINIPVWNGKNYQFINKKCFSLHQAHRDKINSLKNI